MFLARNKAILGQLNCCHSLTKRTMSSWKTSFPILEIKPTSDNAPSLVASDSFAKPPIIIVLQEWWGINDQIKSFAERISNGTGAHCLIPDLYEGKVGLDQKEAEHLMNDLDWKNAIQDLDGLVASIKKDGDRKVGSIGFCMGGALSLALAAQCASTNNALNACVSFYGIPPSKLIDISRLPLSTPTQAHFGRLDKLQGFSDPAAAEALEKQWRLAIQKDGGPHIHGFHKDEANVYIYENQGHAFMSQENTQRAKMGFPPVNPEVQRKVWRRVFDFFIKHLKTV